MHQAKGKGCGSPPTSAFPEDGGMPSGHGPIGQEHMGADGDGEQHSVGQPCADQGWKVIGVEIADRREIESVQ